MTAEAKPGKCQCIRWRLISGAAKWTYDPYCISCNGTGRVWPSVEGEVVAVERPVEMIAYRDRDDVTGEPKNGIHTGEYHFDIDAPGPGLWRVILQPLPEAQKEGGGDE